MNKFKKITNQQFLKELELRLTDFDDDEFVALMKLMIPYQQKVMELLQAANPQIHDWWQEKQQQLIQEKTDQEVEVLKKSLADKEKK